MKGVGNKRRIWSNLQLDFFFNRWIRHGLRIIFLKAGCKNFDLSFHNIIFYDYLSEEISQKFHENFREISRNFTEMFRNSSTPHPTPLSPQHPQHPPHYPPTPYLPWNFKLVFLDNTNWTKFTVYFLPPSFNINNIYVKSKWWAT